jgi:trans-aconitate methyltransferase
MLIKKVFDSIDRSDVKFYGIDVEKKMIDFAKKNNKFENCKFKVADIKDYKMSNFNIITSYYTLQFINPSNRQKIVDKIF